MATISEALDYNFFTEFVDDLSATQSVSLAGNNNQVNGHGAHGNINGDVNTAVLQERIKSLEALLAEKERLINVLLEGRK